MNTQNIQQTITRDSDDDNLLNFDEALMSLGSDSASESVPPDHMEIVECVKKDDLMGAIQLYCSMHGSHFEEASAFVEDIKLRFGY
jgi:hypothetical protein